MAQIVYEVVEPVLKSDGNVMGIDLGVKCPAVSYCSDGKIKFYGNGRKNKYMRRHYAYLRKKSVNYDVWESTELNDGIIATRCRLGIIYKIETVSQ